VKRGMLKHGHRTRLCPRHDGLLARNDATTSSRLENVFGSITQGSRGQPWALLHNLVEVVREKAQKNLFGGWTAYVLPPLAESALKMNENKDSYCSPSPRPNGFPSPPRVSFPTRDVHFANRGPQGEGDTTPVVGLVYSFRSARRRDSAKSFSKQITPNHNNQKN